MSKIAYLDQLCTNLPLQFPNSFYFTFVPKIQKSEFIWQGRVRKCFILAL